MQQSYRGMRQGYAGIQQGYAGIQQSYTGMQQGYAGMQQGYTGMQTTQYNFAPQATATSTNQQPIVCQHTSSNDLQSCVPITQRSTQYAQQPQLQDLKCSTAEDSPYIY